MAHRNQSSAEGLDGADMTKTRMICWISWGAPSAVAAKRCLVKWGSTRDVIAVNCDTRPSEHEDNYRFSKECEKWLGIEIIYIRNEGYKTVDEVFEQTRYMAGVRGARCTTELKKIPRLKFANPDDIHVFGLAYDERDRVKNFKEHNPDLLCEWILVDLEITKQECISELRMTGIELPMMYRLGFDNNNCPGCVKASSPWYWSMIRKHFPDVFARRCEQSRAIGCRLVEISHHNRIFLDELPDREFPKHRENLSCGPECGIQTKLFNAAQQTSTVPIP